MKRRLQRWWERQKHPIGERRKLTITNDDIANGEIHSVLRCAVALAARRLFPERSVMVTPMWVAIANYKPSSIWWREEWQDPSGKLTEWILAYDKDKPVQPITVTLIRSRYTEFED